MLINKRDIIKTNLQSQIDIEKMLSDFVHNHNNGISTNTNNSTNLMPLNEVNHFLSIYKEALNLSFIPQSLFTKEDSKLFLEKVFNILSLKREELIKLDLKKITAKEAKNQITKILEEQEIIKWNLTEETLKKLHDMVK